MSAVLKNPPPEPDRASLLQRSSGSEGKRLACVKVRDYSGLMRSVQPDI